MKKTLAIIAAILTIGYLLPGAVATCRGHRNGTAIWMLNLLTGWTFIGWVASIVWAFTHQGAEA